MTRKLETVGILGGIFFQVGVILELIRRGTGSQSSILATASDLTFGIGLGMALSLAVIFQKRKVKQNG